MNRERPSGEATSVVRPSVDVDALFQTLVEFVAWVRKPANREATSSILADEGLDRILDVLGEQETS